MWRGRYNCLPRHFYKGACPECPAELGRRRVYRRDHIVKLYKEKVMDHYQNPRNRGRMEKPDFSTGEFNPSCGDSVGFQGHVTDGKLTKIMFTGEGCAISQAAASMLTEYCVGKTLDDILKLDKDFMLKLVGMPLGPMRVRCALLSLQALQKGIEDFKKSLNDA